MANSASKTTLQAPDLAGVIQAYNEVTERLEQSHELLRREVGRLHEELKQKNKELERRERLAALGEMAAGVAHEIRNPLGGIGLFSSLLERDLVDRPESLELARRIGGGVRRLDRIVGDILAFAGDAQPRRSRVRLAAVVESAVADALPQATALGSVVTVDTDPTGVELYCDAAQLRRAVLNLLLNAIAAAGRNGRVWVRAGEQVSESEFVSVVVEDDGPGVDPEVAQRVFNPFFTTKENGTGLGLAIVHRIAEAHGGCVRVEARRGGGASFVLRFPRGVAEPVPA